MRIFAASNAGGRDHEDDSFRPPASKAGLVLLGGALFVSDDGAGATMVPARSLASAIAACAL